MKTRTGKTCLLLFAAAVLAFAARAAELTLTVPPGETVTLTESATYDTITVRGTLNVSNAAKISVKNVWLGLETGDTAVVNVFGDTTCFGDPSTTIITVGENGGTGKLVAPDDGKEHTGTWEEIWAFAYKTLTVSPNATVGSDGYIDIMELKKSATSGGAIVNAHATGTARITATGNVRFGGRQYYGAVFFTGKIEIEQKTDGKGIYLGPRYAPMTLAPANSGLVLRNVAMLTVRGVGEETKDVHGKVTVHPGVSWGGCMLNALATYTGFTTDGDNVFPWGTGTGRLSLSEETTRLAIGKTTQHLDALETHKGRSAAKGYAVTGSNGAKIILGDGGTNGALSGDIAPVIALEKTGSGTLFVTNTLTAGTLTVSSGTLQIAAPAVFDTLDLAAGATLTIDGIAVTTRTHRVNGTLTCLNGGRLVAVETIETDTRLAGYAASETLVKSGAGTLTLENPASMARDVKVEAGTLTFSAEGYTVPLYRFSATRWIPNNTMARFSFTRFTLIDADGQRACTGLKYRTAGTDPADLQPGEVTVPAGYIDWKSYWQADSLFSTDTEASRLDILSPVLTNAVDGAVLTNEMSFTFTTPVGDKPAVAYNWSPAWAGRPIDWTLSGSFDGGATWVLLHAETNFRIKSYLTDHIWVNGTDIGPNVPPVFPLFTADPRAASTGVTGMPDALSLEVSAGARADFGNVTGGQCVHALTIDRAGAGSVSNIVFAATGTLNLRSNGEPAAVPETLPLVIEGASDLAHLAGWTVRENGVDRKVRLACKDGRLTLLPFGLSLVIR